MTTKPLTTKPDRWRTLALQMAGDLLQQGDCYCERATKYDRCAVCYAEDAITLNAHEIDTSGPPATERPANVCAMKFRGEEVYPLSTERRNKLLKMAGNHPPGKAVFGISTVVQLEATIRAREDDLRRLYSVAADRMSFPPSLLKRIKDVLGEDGCHDR